MQTEPITILSRPPYEAREAISFISEFLKKRLKSLAYFFSKKPQFLPDSEIHETMKSLIRGFTELGIPFLVNPWKTISKTVFVCGSSEALQYALAAKARGEIKVLIAGPGISTMPADHDKIIANLSIDAVLLPSQKVKERWASIDQYFEKAVVWTAGTRDDGDKRSENGFCLVYSRGTDLKLFNHIMEVLWSHKVPIMISKYGHIRNEEYTRVLGKTRFLIYLDNGAHQPLPLYHAWISNIPSLLHRDTGEEIPAGCGLSFNGVNDFETRFIEFNEKYNSFTPRQVACTKYTDSISAGALRRIIDEL